MRCRFTGQHRQHDDRFGTHLPRRPPRRQPGRDRRTGPAPQQAAANLRGYFTAHPQEYYDLRGILAPIGDAQRQCNVTVLPPSLASAYSEFMAG